MVNADRECAAREKKRRAILPRRSGRHASHIQGDELRKEKSEKRSRREVSTGGSLKGWRGCGSELPAKAGPNGMRPEVLDLTGVIVVVEVGEIGVPVFQPAE